VQGGKGRKDRDVVLSPNLITFHTFSLDRSHIDVIACSCRTRKRTLWNVEVIPTDKVTIGAHDNLS